MDQALEKQYNKPAKSSSGVIGFTRRKEAVCRWNIIKHEKHQYSEALSNICNYNPEDTYTLHHEFTPTKIEIDKSGVERMVDLYNNRTNIFSLEKDVMNIVTGEKVDVTAYLTCIKVGEEEYKHFKKHRLEDKSVKLFDTIKNVTTLTTSDRKTQQKKPDLKKESLKFMRRLDIARLRGFDIQELLKHEITSTSFYLTKDHMLRKSPKSELAQEIKTCLSTISEQVPFSEMSSAIVIDFMAYCRKVPVKKLQLQTYEDLANNLWQTFQKISSNSARIDIVFDLYLDQRIKQGERTRRSKGAVVETKIFTIKQTLPVELEKFWG